MSQQIIPYVSPEEYLRLERQSEYKSEYLNGEIFAMSGASRKHNLITGNIGSEFNQQLRGKPCEAYISDMRVKVTATGLYTYPDVIVVCGEPKFEDKYVDTLLNPTLLVEVLSPSTERYDRIAKSSYYRTLDSLAEHTCSLRRTRSAWSNTLSSRMDSGYCLSVARSTTSLSFRR